MIGVVKPSAVPAVLLERGREATAADEAAFEDGVRGFELKGSIYGHSTVKDALIEAQHGKCAFCESKIRHIDHGDVEHFRPKGGFRQSEADPIEKPGYFWLAYVWDNLFLACARCNQSFKKNWFPLADPNRRARSHLDDLSAEQPLLLDPAHDDPSMFVGFRAEVAFPINDDPRASATIEVLGLNREALAEQRLDHLAPFVRLREVLPLLPEGVDEVQEIQAFFEQAVAADAQYSSMVRAFLNEPS